MHFAVGAEAFRSDAKQYWALASYENLRGIASTMRGYAFSAILLPVRGVNDAVNPGGLTPFRIIWSLAVAYTLTWPLPNAALLFLGGKLSAIRRVTFALLLLCVYPGLLIFPLSDFPAVFLLVVSCFLAKGSSHTLLNAAFAGIVWYLAYNTRTIYLVTLPGIVLLMLLSGDGSTVSSRGLKMSLFIVGAAFASIPQIVANLHENNGPSPAVMAQAGSRPLMVAQLFWGLPVQKFETATDPASVKSIPVSYIDPAGVKLRSAVDSQGTATLGDYTRMAINHPLVVGRLYLRHILNGLNVTDHFVYTPLIAKRSPFSTVLSFTILFLGAFSFSCGKRPSTRWCLAGLLLLPVVAIVPGAVETRFFLPVFLLAAAAIATHSRWSESVSGSKRKLWLGAAYIVGLAVFFSAGKYADEHKVIASPVVYGTIS